MQRLSGIVQRFTNSQVNLPSPRLSARGAAFVRRVIVVGHDTAARFPPGISQAGGRLPLALLLTPLMRPDQQQHADAECRQQDGGCSKQDRNIHNGCGVRSLMCRRARGRQKAYRHAGSIDDGFWAARTQPAGDRCLPSLVGSR